MTLDGKTIWLSCPTTVQETELFGCVEAALEQTGATVLDATRIERHGVWTRQFSRHILSRVNVLVLLPRADGTIGHWTHSEMKAASASGRPVYVLDRSGQFHSLRHVMAEKLDGNERERALNYARLTVPPLQDSGELLAGAK
ncbi:MAG: hypothetical protein ACYDAG_12230 [Chloroflexota bacterium]